MIVVGFDTSTPLTVVAATRDGEPLASTSVAPGPNGQPLHTSRLLPEVEAAVAAAGGWDAVDRVAVGIGPGSFTGLRVGIATARALAQGLGKPVVPVGSLAALARGMAERVPEGFVGPLLAVTDARRSQAFAALYEEDGREAIWEPFVASPEELAARVCELPRPPLAAGDGAVRFGSELETAGALVPPQADPIHAIDAVGICRLAQAASPIEPATVTPLYLRAPDAERWIERDRR